jgi:hypothetical protein
MKKRNKHFFKEKEYLSLKKRLEEIRHTQRRFGWLDLPEPRFIGWTAKIRPRPDILNREDSWVFSGICDLYSVDSFAKRIDYFEWEQKKKKYKDRFVIYSKPHIKSISESDYLSLVPQASRWFVLDEHSSSWRKWYYCKIPNYYWEIYYEKEYQTKVKVSDVLLEQEESEIESRLKSEFYWFDTRCRKSPKSWRKILNRREKSRSKTVLSRIWKGEDVDFQDNYRGAAWSYW